MILSKTVLVHVLSALFGISSWIAINGLWVETPILVNVLPEKWKLASYITLITQVANVGPISYSLLRRFIARERLERPTIHLVYAVGTVALVAMIFVWRDQWMVGSSAHAVPFLLLTFCLSLVDCTSSVLYAPFMSSIPSKFLVSHLIGQSLSGLIPSFIALAQGVGGVAECVNFNGTTHEVFPEPRFSVNVFLILLVILVGASWIAFAVLSSMKVGLSYDDIPGQTGDRSEEKRDLSQSFVVLLLVLEAAICGLTNGVIPAIQPYSVLAYNNVTYHFVVTLAAISSPIGCLLTSIRLRRPQWALAVTLPIALAAASYILTSALHSPDKLIENNLGHYVIVFIWIVNNLFFSYSRTTITKLWRSQTESNRLLFLGGIFTQLGSAIGAFVIFYFVNYTNSFTLYRPCQGKP